MEKCIFCEIAAKRTSAHIIYENEEFLAFLDVNPLNQGHTLVVPKKHVRWVYEVENFGVYAEIAKSVALAVIDALDAKFVNIMTAGLGVQHAHIHVVPRFEDDGHPELPAFGNVKKISKEEMIQIAGKIKDTIAKHPPKKAVSKKAEKIEKVEEVKEEKPKEIRSKEQIEYIRREMERG